MTHGTKRAAEVYDVTESHEELIRWPRAYCTHTVAAYGFDVILGPVCWEVSTQAKHHTAMMKTPTVGGASVGRVINWSVRANGFGESVPPGCAMSLSWRAFEPFDREEWSATLQHELIHVEQFQAFDAADHGPTFRRRAEAVGTPVRVRRFAEPKYTLSCEARGADVVYRYHECKLVHELSAYRSACCGTPLHCQKRRE